jgi:hypothetical protein
VTHHSFVQAKKMITPFEVVTEAFSLVFVAVSLQLQICALNLNHKNSGQPIALFDGLWISVEKLCHWTINRNVK